MKTLQMVMKSNPPPCPESIWAILQENAIGLKELKESQKELREIQKETEKKLGKLGNRMGEVVEYMIAPNLCKKFAEYGYDFEKSHNGTIINDSAGNYDFEVDVLLENCDKAMLVEIKTKLTTEDVKVHIDRMNKMRKYADLKKDKRTFLGAVAGVVMTPYVKNFALEKGFFVIQPSGETFNITPPNKKPKEW